MDSIRIENHEIDPYGIFAIRIDAIRIACFLNVRFVSICEVRYPLRRNLHHSGSSLKKNNRLTAFSIRILFSFAKFVILYVEIYTILVVR